MSFSGKVREELSGELSTHRHCQIAELSALISFLGKVDENALGDTLNIPCDNEAAHRKCFTLLKKTFNIENALNSGDTERVLQAASGPAVTAKSCCKRAYLRGAFLAVGSVSDPDKSYHLEFVCQSNEQAEKLIDLLGSFEIDAKQIQRKKYHVVYIKEGSQIVETLNVIGAHVALMDFENSRILKDMRNSVNRRVNCETANLDKTVNASVKQIADIEKLMKSGIYRTLPDTLQQIAEVRMQYPDASLKELGEYMNPPIGKSGVNHRLRKLSEAAAKLP